jgi:hypothetical protein
MAWTINYVNKPKLNTPLLIEGMPGIGNVGKIVADMLVDQLKAKKLADIYGRKLPNSVFVNEENLVELPSIELFYARAGKQDVIILSGDAQPIDEESCYEFCETVLEHAKRIGTTQLITLAGIGLSESPMKSQTFCTGTDKKFIEELAKAGANPKIHGKVGPILGVSGLLLGVGARHGFKTASLLSETYAHPLHAGFEGAKSSLAVLAKYLGIKFDYVALDEAIKEIRNAPETESKLETINKLKSYKETTYIG